MACGVQLAPPDDPRRMEREQTNYNLERVGRPPRRHAAVRDASGTRQQPGKIIHPDPRLFCSRAPRRCPHEITKSPPPRCARFAFLALAEIASSADAERHWGFPQPQRMAIAGATVVVPLLLALFLQGCFVFC